MPPIPGSPFDMVRQAIEKLSNDGEMTADLAKKAIRVDVTRNGWTLVFPPDAESECMLLTRLSDKLCQALNALCHRMIDLQFAVDQAKQTTPAQKAKTRSVAKPAAQLPISKALAEEYDRLNQKWKQAEQQFSALLIPQYVEYAFHSYVSDPDDQEQIYDILSWEPYGKDWRLCYSWYPEHEPFGRDTRPIIECSADIRVRAVKALIPLREKLVAKGEDFLQEVRAAREEIEAAVGTERGA